MSRFIIWIYIGVSIANLIAMVLPSEELNQFTKPLLMPLLMILVYKSSLERTTLRILQLCGALLFSWLGDMLLMYQEVSNLYFMGGIGLFLIAQIIYIIVLKKSMYQKSEMTPRIVLPFLIYAGLLFYVLLPAGDFTIPIVIYGVVIMFMVLIARLREGNTSHDSYQFVFLGSLLFVVSDSLLAFNVFHTAIPYAGVVIMLTYCAAQLLIVLGILKHIE